MASAAPSDTESSVSGFVRYNDKHLAKLYVSIIQNMEAINQDLLAVEKNLQNIIKQAGPLESQLCVLLQNLPKINVNLITNIMATISTRPKSPTRAEAIARALKPGPIFNTGVLLGNWVEDRIECPKGGTFYFPPKEKIDYEKMKPESRQPDFRLNKLNSLQGNLHSIYRHDSHDKCGNFATTNDLVYNHLPKPLCGPDRRYYKKCKHQFYPQPDFMKCFGNVTEWGLRKYKQYEWACTDVSDYTLSLYEDTYVPPQPHQYLQKEDRKARNSTFTKSFRFKMTKQKSNLKS